MKKLLISFIYLFFLSVYTQNINLPSSVHSPNAESLGKYGDVPVSFFNGTPNISIPLYSLNERNIPLNISLNYDASGVRVNSMPSWVGQNWSLNAGGVITRTVKSGSPDEHNYTGNGVPGKGYFYSECRSLLNTEQWDDNSYLDVLWGERLNNTLIKEFEPDIFTFNFMGHTGKFFLGEDGFWKVSSSSNLRIYINETDFRLPFDEVHVPFNSVLPNQSSVLAVKMIYKITIVDDFQNSYVFGNTNNSVEYSTSFWGQSNPSSCYWVSDSWFLTQVKDRLGNIVYDFEYDRGSYIAEFYNMGFYVGYDQSSDVNWLGRLFGDLSMGQECWGFYGNGTQYNGKLISPVYLKKIKFNGKEINFGKAESNGKSYINDDNLVSTFANDGDFHYMNYGMQFFYYYLYPYSDPQTLAAKLKWYKLTSISGLGKSYNFNYNDNTPSANGQYDRLNLSDIIVNINYDGNQYTHDKKYSFEYDSFSELPNYLSKEIDHWGYYDGSTYVVPNFYTTSQFQTHYNRREPNSDKLKKGMLIKMTYPTGGFSEFEWEANQYSGYVSDDKSSVIYNSTNMIAGGVRIKRIKNYTDVDILADQKVYEYLNDDGTRSSGLLNCKPKYYWDNYTLTTQDSGNTITLNEDLFDINSMIPLSNFSGGFIGYSRVKEINMDGGYTIYKYTSHEDTEFRDEYHANPRNPTPTPYKHYSDKSLLRGMLKSKTIYNSDNVILMKQETKYSFDPLKFAKSVDVLKIGCSTGNGFIKGGHYKLYYFDNSMIEDKVITYYGTNMVEEKTEYTYTTVNDNILTNVNYGDQFLKTKTKYNSLNSLLKEEFTYTFEIPYLTQHLTLNNYFQPVKVETFENSTKLNSNYYEFGSYTIGTSEVKFPMFHYSSKGTGTPIADLKIEKYDLFGNIIEISNPNIPVSIHTYFIWGYNNTQIIAKIENFTDSQAQSIQSIINNAVTKSNIDNIGYDISAESTLRYALDQLRNDSALINSTITTYTYDPYIGVTSIKDPKGDIQYFTYDRNNRLKFVKDKDNNIISKHEYNFRY